MKYFRRRLAIILAMVMVITSFTFLDVSAEGDLADVEVSAITGFESFSSFESVVLEWDKATVTKKPYTLKPVVDSEGQETGETTKEYGTPVESAASYKVMYNGKTVDIGKGTEVTVNGKTKIQYTSDKLTPGSAYNSGDIRFDVVAYDPNTGKEGSPAAIIDAPVRTIAYRVKVKKSGTLKSHGGPSRSIRVTKGQYIYAYGFGGGKYIFEDNGSIFYCNMSRTKSRSCVYTNAFNYTRKEAEFYINKKAVTSGTNSLIWINTYTQHLYRFVVQGGRWVCINDFECSTGKAKTPSPTGVSGYKAIWKKIGKRHGVKYWSPYSDINSIHAKKAKWKIGVPSSNGCIRNYEQNAYDVYVNAPIGTRVLLY